MERSVLGKKRARVLSDVTLLPLLQHSFLHSPRSRLRRIPTPALSKNFAEA